jgi:uncharacterized membrane protein YdjX (TVP38/TMEM64 family)
MITATPSPKPVSRTRLILTLGITAVVLAALILGGRQALPYIPRFNLWVESLGIWGPVVFILGYAVATVAFIPGSLLTGAAGYLFGLVQGTLYTFVGATLGSSAAFLVARYLVRGWVERRIAGNDRFAAIDRAVGKEGFKIVALLRLSPFFPFNLLNYSLGLTRVRFLDYLLASVAMLPGTVLYVYYGTVAGSLASAAGGAKGERGPGQWVVLGIGLIATIVVTTVITRLAGRALRQQIGEEDPHG